MGRRTFYINWLIILTSVLLLALGLVTLLSIDRSYFSQQLIFGVIGIGLMIFFARINFSIYPYLDRVILIFSIIFLCLSYLGPNVRGATRWLMIGPLSIQPSEFVKPFFLLGIASLMVRFPPTKLIRIVAHTVLFVVTFTIVLRQPDLGSALVYASMWITVIVLAGLPLKYIVGSLLSVLGLLPILYQFLHEYQKLRIVTFLDPLHDPQGSGYNAIQSMISVGSGQLFGRGFGRGTQSLLQFLPERHTDFIFASFSEEFGFIGGFILLIIFFVLLLQLLMEASKKFNYSVEFLYLVGFFAQMLTHIVINVGMNMGIVPITGITLPFVSYGGSSLLTTCIALGIAIAAIQPQRQFE